MKFLYLSGVIIGFIFALNLFLSLFNIHFFNFMSYTGDDRTFLGYLRSLALSLLFFYCASKCYDEFEKEEKKKKRKRK